MSLRFRSSYTRVVAFFASLAVVAASAVALSTRAEEIPFPSAESLPQSTAALSSQTASSHGGARVNLSRLSALPRTSDDGVVRMTDETGLTVAVEGPRAELSTAGASLAQVTFEAIGRDGALSAPLKSGPSEVDGYTLWQNYSVDGIDVSEYWVVDAGIEHGYLLSQRPAGVGSLQVSLSFSGVTASGDSDSQRLTSDSGETVLEWGQLLAWDSEGRLLPARFSNAGNEVSLVVDDSQASYPIVIDPTFTQEAKLVSPNPVANGYFSAVDVDGDTLVVGAPGETVGGLSGAGAAYVFTRSGSAWSQQARLTPSDAAANDSFGSAVSVSGDTILVGAWGDDSAKGSAYIFVRSGGSWTESKKLTAQVGGANDQFGRYLALSGDTAVIGATRHNSEQGAAYVFVRAGGTWPANETVKLTASDAANFDRFGRGVAVDGDTLVVGAASRNDGGAVYVFERIGSVWQTTHARMASGDLASSDLFGLSVSVDGDTIVVGAPYDDDGGSGSGAAYVFSKTGGTWPANETQKLTASDAAANDEFGWSVAVGGDTIVVSAPGDDDGGSGSGAAYVFSKTGGAWQANETQKLNPSDSTASIAFGDQLSISGDVIAVGAIYSSPGGVSRAGATYVFRSLQAPQENRSMIRASGSPGIFLTITAASGRVLSGTDTVFGAYAVKPNSPYMLTIQSSPGGPKTILARGATNASGHLEQTVTLPAGLSGSHLVSLVAMGASGELLQLGNRLEIDPRGVLVSKTPESAQPQTR